MNTIFFIAICFLILFVFIFSMFILIKNRMIFFKKNIGMSDININLFGIKIILVPVIFLIISSSVIYYILGDKQQNLKSESNLSLNNTEQIRTVSNKIKKELYKLEYQTDNDPNDLNSWWKLAKLYQMLKEFKSAEEAFYKAYMLQPDNIELAYQYAFASSQTRGGMLSNEGLDILENFLKNDKSNASIFNLLAMDSYNKNNYKKAISYWEKAVEILQQHNDSSLSNSIIEINKMIGLAKSKVI